jgi:uncharacterized membrane protein YgcG
MLRHLGLLALALAVALLALAPQARAVYPPPVKDDGKFFTAEGLKKANAKIKDIYKKYKKDVVVETIDALSVDDEKKAKEEGNMKYFTKHGVKRIDDLGVNGVYLVLSKKPRFGRIVMDPQTQKAAFKAADRDKAYAKLVERFKESEFDEGLLAALDSIEASLKANSPKLK